LVFAFDVQLATAAGTGNLKCHRENIRGGKVFRNRLVAGYSSLRIE